MTTKKTKSARTASSPQSLTLEEIRQAVATQQSIIDAAKAQMDMSDFLKIYSIKEKDESK